MERQFLSSRVFWDDNKDERLASIVIIIAINQLAALRATLQNFPLYFQLSDVFSIPKDKSFLIP